MWRAARPPNACGTSTCGLLKNQVSHQGIVSAMPKAFRKQTPFRGCLSSHSTFSAASLQHVSRLKMPHYALNCRYAGATFGRGLEDVPTSYRYYLGNLGFF